MSTRVFATMIALVLGPSVAHAQWLHQEQGGAFDDKKMQIAVTAMGNYGFGFRCTGGDDLTAIFLTPEEATDSALETLNLLKPQLLLRVDDLKPHEISASAESTDKGLGVMAEVAGDVAREVRDGAKRVSIAVRVMGEIYHETEFSLRGSTSSISKLMEACGVPAS